MRGSWKDDYKISSDYTDFRGQCRLSSLLALMQRAADAHVENMGVPWQEMKDSGMGWMLITLDIEFKRMPQILETISIQTWSKGTKGVLWLRDYRVLDEAGSLILQSRTVWALVDVGKRKILRPSAFPYQLDVHSEESIGDVPDKVQVPSDVLLHEAYQVRVRYSGIDANGHLNNSRYVDICMDALTEEELNRISPRTFRITYHNEARMGDDILLLRSELSEGSIYFRGEFQDGKPVFEACMVLGSN
ncbi:MULTISPECIES: acyl-ACP thioesterase domain-containing protein [unclassified Paenibacillus]|uniref:acyl-[acyl-carrier-protein] thioesterase n=1 Tax=unclassified Paenibacillus TaxID=185978 RepID=UPI001AE132A4|nr:MULTISPECIES: acyl-ACP thioesterase domain-containing protein [unclassified Paenibacillus]MBP1155002.1 acyl-ACP thioesterase [Paenibacillus sp. PvP091]MBP1169615.1 acyl-ACP thioesterase [Paenibacillus sp. PvR098]MBP2440643.1 acyl-ACP thioesterase [Paenibacillus sp. PvP052]